MGDDASWQVARWPRWHLRQAADAASPFNVVGRVAKNSTPVGV